MNVKYWPPATTPFTTKNPDSWPPCEKLSAAGIHRRYAPSPPSVELAKGNSSHDGPITGFGAVNALQIEPAQPARLRWAVELPGGPRVWTGFALPHCTAKQELMHACGLLAQFQAKLAWQCTRIAKGRSRKSEIILVGGVSSDRSCPWQWVHTPTRYLF
jgi:hypothetical protein